MWRIVILLFVIAIENVRGKHPIECPANHTECARVEYLCYWDGHKCDGWADCIDGTDECGCESFPCPADRLQCENDLCSFVNGERCDGVRDCYIDGSDERNCTSCNPSGSFAYDVYHCQQEQRCLVGDAELHNCDGFPDCDWQNSDTSSDEQNCNECKHDAFHCSAESRCIPGYWRCDGVPDCSNNMTTAEDEQNCGAFCQSKGHRFCSADNTCIWEHWWCDGIPDCSDGEDEGPTMCVSATHCENTGQKFCSADAKCIMEHSWCDGYADCSDGEDENTTACGQYCEDEGLAYCSADTRCIYKNWWCDGYHDCSDSEDEHPSECEDYCEDEGMDYCSPENKCLPGYMFCNGVQDCSDDSDEDECPGKGKGKGGKGKRILNVDNVIGKSNGREGKRSPLSTRRRIMRTGYTDNNRLNRKRTLMERSEDRKKHRDNIAQREMSKYQQRKDVYVRNIEHEVYKTRGADNVIDRRQRQLQQAELARRENLLRSINDNHLRSSVSDENERKESQKKTLMQATSQHENKRVDKSYRQDVLRRLEARLEKLLENDGL